MNTLRMSCCALLLLCACTMPAADEDVQESKLDSVAPTLAVMGSMLLTSAGGIEATAQDTKYVFLWQRALFKPETSPSKNTAVKWTLYPAGFTLFEHVRCEWSVGDQLYELRQSRSIAVISRDFDTTRTHSDQQLLTACNTVIADVLADDALRVDTVITNGRTLIAIPSNYPSLELSPKHNTAIVGVAMDGRLHIAVEMTSEGSSFPRLLLDPRIIVHEFSLYRDDRD